MLSNELRLGSQVSFHTWMQPPGLNINYCTGRHENKELATEQCISDDHNLSETLLDPHCFSSFPALAEDWLSATDRKKKIIGTIFCCKFSEWFTRKMAGYTVLRCNRIKYSVYTEHQEIKSSCT